MNITVDWGEKGGDKTAVTFEIDGEIQMLHGDIAKEIAEKLFAYDRHRAFLLEMRQKASDVYDEINDMDLDK